MLPKHDNQAARTEARQRNLGVGEVRHIAVGPACEEKLISKQNLAKCTTFWVRASRKFPLRCNTDSYGVNQTDLAGHDISDSDRDWGSFEGRNQAVTERSLLAEHHAPESRPSRRVEVVERVGKAIMVERAGFRPPVAEFAGGQIPHSAWSLQLRIELTPVDLSRIRRQEPPLLSDLVVGGVQEVGPVDHVGLFLPVAVRLAPAAA